MNKKYLVGLAVAMALPFAASAATFSNVQFDNGDVTVSGQGNSTVQATFHVIVPSGQVVEYIQTDVIGDNLAPVDTSVGGELGLQEGTHDVTLSVKLPPNTGTYTLNVQGAGIYGGIRSVSGNDNVVGTGSFGSALRVVADTTATTGGSSSDMPSWFSQFLALFGAASHPATTTPVVTVSPKCEAIAPFLGATPYAYSSVGVQLQSALLLDNPYSIPLLQAGSTVQMGYFGVQTHAALATYTATYHCN